MKKTVLKLQRQIVITSSIVGIILFGIMLFQGIKIAMNLPTSETRMNEYIVMLFWIPLIIPALLGLFHFIKKSVKENLTVGISFLIYLFASLLTYYIYFQSTDALAGGFLFIILLYPVSIISSIILGAVLFKEKWA
jgi:hypothetical protein